MRRRFETVSIGIVAAFLLVAARTGSLFAQLGTPEKLGYSSGLHIDRIADLDHFGSAMANVGDLDGDGFDDLAVGSPFDDDISGSSNADQGAVWILFMTQDGWAHDQARISATSGGFDGPLNNNDWFGSAIARLGDLDGDGNVEIGVGAPRDDDGGRDRGAVWILSIDKEGIVVGQRKLGSAEGVTGLSDDDYFGSSISSLGDVNGDGTTELAVGAPGDDGGGDNRGAVWILSLRPDATLASMFKINSTDAAFADSLDDDDRFGSSLAGLGDLDSDGSVEFAVGAPLDDDGSSSTNGNRGAVWILSLSPNLTSHVFRKISASRGRFSGQLDDNDRFGSSVTSIGDLDRDGITDLAVGAALDDDGGSVSTSNRGAVWILFLQTGDVAQPLRFQKLSADTGDFEGILDQDDQFGASVAPLGDLNGDGSLDLAVGAPQDDDGGGSSTSDRGAVWVLFLRTDGSTRPVYKINSIDGHFAGTIDSSDFFGSSLAALHTAVGTEEADLAVGAPGDDDGARDAGAVWILSFSKGAVTHVRKISNEEGRLGDILDAGVGFGASVAPIGDLNGDGWTDLAVGANLDDDGAVEAGAIWILFLDERFQVLKASKISSTSGNLGVDLPAYSHFGSAVTTVGDLDGDGISEIAVGAPNHDDGLGEAWILSLNPADASVNKRVRVAPGEGAFVRESSKARLFGSSMAGSADLNGDGIPDLVVGAGGDINYRIGEVWALFLDRDGGIQSARNLVADFPLFNRLGPAEQAGTALALPGDVNHDGHQDLLFSSIRAYREGSIWLMMMGEDATPLSIHEHDTGEGDLKGIRLTETGIAFSVAALGDIDGDQVSDIALGAPLDHDGNVEAGVQRGSVWIAHNVLIPPPVISSVSVDPQTPSVGDQIRFRANVEALDGAQNVRVTYRTSGDSAFSSTNLSPIKGSMYSATLQSFNVGDRGIEYFISAENVHGHVTRYPPYGILSVSAFLPDGLVLHPAPGTAENAYRLFSIPLELESADATGILTASLGSYDRKRWRFYGYGGNAHRLELDNGDMDLVPGSAFWLLVRDEGETVSTGPGTTVTTAEPFKVGLKPGWNYVGNPFNFSVPLSNLRLASDASDEGPPVDARSYHSNWDKVEGAILPLEAYAVFSDNPDGDTLLIDPDLTRTSDQARSPKFADAGKAGGGDLDWAIHIRAESGRARDDDNVAGLAAGASDTRDAFDLPEPPTIGDFVTLYFPHPDWGAVVDRFSTDARPAGEPGEAWDFEVRTANPAPVTLTFRVSGAAPPDFRMSIDDLDFGGRSDLAPDGSVTLASFGSERARRLRLVAGASSYVEGRTDVAGESELPVRTELRPAYPNPMSSVTTIQYDTREDGPVSLHVIDILGRRVATLRDGTESAGRHTIVWGGTNDGGDPVGSGLYFLRLEAAGTVDATELVIAR